MRNCDEIHILTYQTEYTHESRIFAIYWNEFSFKKMKSLSHPEFRKLWQERFPHVKIRSFPQTVEEAESSEEETDIQGDGAIACSVSTPVISNCVYQYFF